MKRIVKYLLAIAILFTYSQVEAQVPSGRYFNVIKGTSWLASEGFKMDHLLKGESFGLALIESDEYRLIDKHAIWTFSDDVTITFYDGASQQPGETLTCHYKHDGTFSLSLMGGEVEYKYVSVSTGAYVQFTCVKKVK